MSNQARDCWGCGQPLIFKTMSARQIVAFLAKTGEPHSCPRHPTLPPIFLPAMQDYRRKVQCPWCDAKVYQVPARHETSQTDYALQFEQVIHRPIVHKCGHLAGIWDYTVQSIARECDTSTLPKHHRLVTLVCVKRIAGPDPLFLIALKGVSGRRSCDFFQGGGEPKAGDLAVACGRHKPTLIINSKNANHHLQWNALGAPEMLSMRHDWVLSASR